ncbi:muconolactone D-isomerase [Amycolatopsis bartoniae]|uniref:Muconolactone Delta-isomerase n=1 Tax=Amycolatopsis bartoniae TaxID=941986 RepID=A0A8H9MET5_9PSEU|nr:muconolactone Delta-isomerase family protein [Amycolatopsis bartoniae]MBB2939092.1 muconolactone D-isomerase [Amycolatopsis bartoniae]TVT06346.1 muconolactone delta-isomerase [Amycolatopsis bartoniae]GHF64980.1 muconolactone Delta-isomerase [Amycolatopsis bartoniae]
MDFLVRIDVSRAYDLPSEERADLIAREQARGRELHAEGVLRNIWRVPGTRANVGIWSTLDADALEDALTSLPIRPYAEIDVTALATHAMVRQDPGAWT